MYPSDKAAYPMKEFNLDLYKLYMNVNQPIETIQKPLIPQKNNHPREDLSSSTFFDQIKLF